MSQFQLNSPPPQPQDWSSEVRTDARDITGLGTKIALLALIGFVAWGSLVPIDSAVQATGSVIAQGRNKLVQHKTGGNVRKILAVEGQKVKKGDPLVELDTDVDRAQLSQLKARYQVMKAIKQRLDAEKGSTGGALPLMRNSDDAGEVEFTGSTTDAVVSKADAELLAEQQREFQKGRAALESEITALKERAEGQRRQRKGLQSREALLREQVGMLSKQVSSLRRLANKDHIPKQRLWDVESQLLDRQNELDRIKSEKDSIANAIAEVDSTIANVRAKDQRLTSEKLTEVLGNMEELRDQIVAAENILKDTVVRSPMDGTLVRMNVVTVGGVVPAGEAMAEIVPDGTAVELLARVRPEDISYVTVGQEAEMLITALNARIFDKVPGKVVYVAADASEDRRTGERYFEVRGTLDVASMSRQSGVSITPGMNGQVFLKGKPRSFFGYLLQPIRDGISTAFKEPH
jgi:HlyD family type I secretion membrane fusion protein